MNGALKSCVREDFQPRHRCTLNAHQHMNKDVVCYTMGYYKPWEWNNVICSNMGRPREWHAKWNNSDKERQISFDIT